MATGDASADEEARPIERVFEKIAALRKVLDRDLKVADLKLSLYICACEAISDEVHLWPAPPGYHRDRDLDEDKLLAANQEIPTAELLKYYLSRPRGRRISNRTLDILYWILAARKEPRLVSVPSQDFKIVLNKVALTSDWDRMPDHVFRVMYSATSQWELQWQAVKEGRPTKFGYYTADVHAFHSLINYGIHAAFRADSPKVRLVQDLRLALDSAPESWTWGKSSIGPLLSIVAVVEYVERADESTQLTDRNTVFISDGDQARLRYVLVYTKKSPKDFRLPTFSWMPVLVGRGFLNLMLSAFIIISVSAVRSGHAVNWSRYLTNAFASKVKLWN